MIIFLYGPDSYRSRQKLKELKEKYLREVDNTGNSLIILDGENIDFSKLNEIISPSSLFARKRMVIIERILANKKKGIFKEIIRLFSKNEGSGPQDNIIIVWDDVDDGAKTILAEKKALVEYLKKQKFSQYYELLSNTKASVWLKEEAEKKDVKISLQAANMLIGLTGNNLWLLRNELDKLISYKKAKENKGDKNLPVIIELSDVAEISSGQFSENIFALTDAIGHKNRGLAVKLLEEQILAGADQQKIFGMIVRQIKILVRVREALSIGLSSRQIANQLKLHPFVAQKSITQAGYFNPSILKKIYLELSDIDFANKIGKGELVTMLDLLIAKL